MTRALNDIRSEIAAKTKELAPLIEKVLGGDASNDEMGIFETKKREIEELKAEESDAKRNEERRSDAEELKRLNDEYNTPAGRSISGRVPKGQQRDDEEVTRYRSIGDAFAHSRQLEEFRQRAGMGTNSRAFKVGSLFEDHHDELDRYEEVEPEVRALMGSGLADGELILPQRIPGIVQGDARPLPVRDLFTNGTTDSNSVEYVKMGPRTNNAAEVAEATTLEDGLKPESGFDLSTDSAPVRTIAHIIYATRDALADIGQLRMLIDEFMIRGIEERVDRQLLLGNGVAPNLRGLLSTTGVQVADGDYWRDNPLPADANKWDRLRRMMTMVRITGRARTSGIVLSPAALEEASMAKDQQGRYLFPGGGPFGGGFQTLWGVPVTEQEDLTDTQAIVGDFRRGAAVLDRMQAQIFVSDSNRDLFERNIITILAEARLAFPVYRPEAFVNGDLEALSPEA